MHGGSRSPVPRVAIVFWDGYLGVAPSLINAARCFAQAGYHVDVITREGPSDFAEAPDLGPSVRVSTWSRSRARSRFLRRAAFVTHRLGFLVHALRVTRGSRHAAMVGVDLNGLLIARVLAAARRSRAVLWSLEIHALPPGDSFRGRLSRWLRRGVFGSIEIAVVQDQHRARLLMDGYGVRNSSIVLVPNGPIGEARPTSGDFLHQRFELPPSSKIALHLGMISPTVFSSELAAVARTWPEGWTLVFHERQRRDPAESYLSELRERGGDRVRLSLEPVAYDDIDEVVASGRIGLVLYDASAGLTYSSPGSSGKIGQYMRCGIPVVCLEAKGITDVVERYGSGVSVSDIAQMGAAIEAVDRDWDTYSANALKCYREVYEFGTHFSLLLERLRAS